MLFSLCYLSHLQVVSQLRCLKDKSLHPCFLHQVNYQTAKCCGQANVNIVTCNYGGWARYFIFFKILQQIKSKKFCWQKFTPFNNEFVQTFYLRCVAPVILWTIFCRWPWPSWWQWEGEVCEQDWSRSWWMPGMWSEPEVWTGYWSSNLSASQIQTQTLF